jgi:Sec-independent protein translocase protein TatA
MGGLDPAKVLMVLLVALVVLGPERLPRAARQLGAMWRELSRMRERLEDEVRSALPDIDIPKIPTLPKRGIAGYLTSMMTSSDVQAGAAGAVSSDVMDDRDVGFSSEEAASLPAQAWVSPSAPAGAEVSEIPAGWNVVGAHAPGYASGSMLAPVPSIASAAGGLNVEGDLDFDSPGWN